MPESLASCTHWSGSNFTGSNMRYRLSYTSTGTLPVVLSLRPLRSPPLDQPISVPTMLTGPQWINMPRSEHAVQVVVPLPRNFARGFVVAPPALPAPRPANLRAHDAHRTPVDKHAEAQVLPALDSGLGGARVRGGRVVLRCQRERGSQGK